LQERGRAGGRSVGRPVSRSDEPAVVPDRVTA
jgi:hypothetical protein